MHGRTTADRGEQRLRPRKIRYAAPANFKATNAGSDATSSAATPALAATAHTAWPSTTPHAVRTPARRPPPSVLRTVSAVSWPGVTITTIATPRNASSMNANIKGPGPFMLRGWATRSTAARAA